MPMIQGGAETVMLTLGSGCRQDDASLARLPLTSRCAAQFLTGFEPALVHGPGDGAPSSNRKNRSESRSPDFCFTAPSTSLHSPPYRHLQSPCPPPSSLHRLNRETGARNLLDAECTKLWVQHRASHCNAQVSFQARSLSSLLASQSRCLNRGRQG